MRKKMTLTDHWHFSKEDHPGAEEPAFFSQDWEKVSLPHTWNAIDGANGFDYHRGACWYKRDFFLEKSEEGKKIFLEFEGANSVADVYVNGQHLGQHRGGYSTFRFDATQALHFGQINHLAVKVDNTVVTDVYPQMADFTFYGGLYRDVHLLIVHPLHVDLLDHGSSGVYVVQEEVSSQEATFTVKTKIANDSWEEKKVRLWVEIKNQNGESVTYGAREVILPPQTVEKVSLPLNLEEPRLWKAKEDPHLYQAVVSLTSFNDRVDELVVPFGLRSYYVDAEEGFFLNGEHLPLHGVSRHQDRKDKGWAISVDDQKEDMALIKEVGATSIRLAHYQHSSFFYDLCDQEGMVVWAEIPFISIMSKTELEGHNAKSQMVELIRQNFNHPSICFWGIQNEIQIGGDRPEVRKVVAELNALTKEEDPTRLTTQANVMFVPNDDDYNQITDVVGYNKYYGWYTGKAEDFGPWIDGFHQENPQVKLGISEYGAEGILQYQNDDPVVKDYSESYHTLYHETVWKIFKERPFLWSTYVWNFFDFGANIRDEGGVQGRNNKGLVTYDRKVKKDAFYYYKSQWSTEPFVHITGKRYVDRPLGETTIKVYSNGQKVKLFVGGQWLLPTREEEGIFYFEQVKIQEGTQAFLAQAESGGEIFMDRAFFTGVKTPNESYQAPEAVGGVVDNWFESPDLGEVTVEELVIGDDVYSTQCTIGLLFQTEKTRAIMQRYFGDFEDHPMYAMAEGMTIEQLAELAPEKVNKELLYALNRDLTCIKK